MPVLYGGSFPVQVGLREPPEVPTEQPWWVRKFPTATSQPISREAKQGESRLALGLGSQSQEAPKRPMRPTPRAKEGRLTTLASLPSILGCNSLQECSWAPGGALPIAKAGTVPSELCPLRELHMVDHKGVHRIPRGGEEALRPHLGAPAMRGNNLPILVKSMSWGLPKLSG